MSRLGGTGVRHPISVTGGTQPLWRRDGKELFYREGDKLMAVSLSLAGAPRISPPVMLFERRYAFGNATGIASYDVAPDGCRFVMIKDEGGRAYVRLVLNFEQVLNQIAPAHR